MEILFMIRDNLVRSLLVAILLFIASKYVGQYDLSRLQAGSLGVFLVGLYNVVIWPTLLSPLRVFPQVKLRDIRYLLPVTDVPRGDIALDWAKQYPDSDAVRIKMTFQTFITAFSPRAYRDILGTNQNDFVKPLAGRNSLSGVLGWGLITSEGARHTRQRKAANPAFRIQNIRALHSLMLAKTKIMIGAMEVEMARNGYVEVNKWASKVTLDIIGNSLMSTEFDSLHVEHQPVNEAFTKLTEASPGATLHFMLAAILPMTILRMLPTETTRMTKYNVQLIRDVCNEALRTRDNVTQKSSVGSEILSSIVQDPHTNHEETIDQMMTFLGAGHETTATSIAWATHLLTLPHNIHYQDKLREEIRAQPESVLSPTALETLPWLNAICEETLRLYPPVTSTARIAVRDTTIAETRIPKGTMVFMFPWAVNRHPAYWGGPASEQFIPDRWLDGVEAGQPRFNKHGGAKSNYCELTFLHGGHSCIGRDFAKAELRCILAHIYGQFQLSRLEGDNLIAEPAGSLTIKPKGGLFIRMERVHTL